MISDAEIKRLNALFDWGAQRDNTIDVALGCLRMEVHILQTRSATKARPNVPATMAAMLDNPDLLEAARNRIQNGGYSGPGGRSVFSDEQIIAARATHKNAKEAAKSLGMGIGAFYNRIHRIKHGVTTRTAKD